MVEIRRAAPGAGVDQSFSYVFRAVLKMGVRGDGNFPRGRRSVLLLLT